MRRNTPSVSERLLFRRPFSNTDLWMLIFLIVIAVLRVGHLLRCVTGATFALASQVLSLLVVLVLVRPDRRKDLGFCRFRPRWWFISILGGFAAGLTIAAINHLLIPSCDWILAMDESLIPDAWRALPFGLTEVGLAVIGGVLTPLAEEFFFRGLLMTAWRKRIGEWTLLIVQALIFGFLHLAHAGVEIFPRPSIYPGLAANIFVTTLLGGFLFGLVRLRSGSIWPAVMAHAAVNLGAALVFVP